MEVCKEKHKRLDEKIETIEGRINTHGKEIEEVKGFLGGNNEL